MGIKWLLEKYTNRIIKIRLKYRNVLCRLYNFHISKSTIIFRILPIQFSEGEYIKALFSISWTNIDAESFNNGFYVRLNILWFIDINIRRDRKYKY